MSRGGPEAIRRILQKSTTSEGIITVELLSRELLKEGYEEPTAEQVIGSAEVEGILIRKAPNLWAWLQ